MRWWLGVFVRFLGLPLLSTLAVVGVGCPFHREPSVARLVNDLDVPAVSDFWVGVRGDLTAEAIEALRGAGIVVYDLRRTAGGWGDPPVEWETLRTFVSVSAADELEANAEVAGVLGLDADDLLACSAEFFG